MSEPMSELLSKVHPIRRLVEAGLGPSDDAREVLAFTPLGGETIAAVLERLTVNPSEELVDAVETLFSVADWLETEGGSPRAADALIAMVETPLVINALKQLNQQADDRVEADPMASAAQLGLAVPPRIFNSEVPSGALKVAALDFPRRM